MSVPDIRFCAATGTQAPRGIHGHRVRHWQYRHHLHQQQRCGVHPAQLPGQGPQAPRTQPAVELPRCRDLDVETLDAPANSPASGAPVITGTAPFGETLTAGTSGISDSHGLTGVQWVRSSNGTDAGITGATSSTWNLAFDELCDVVESQASFVKLSGGGFREI